MKISPLIAGLLLLSCVWAGTSNAQNPSDDPLLPNKIWMAKTSFKMVKARTPDPQPLPEATEVVRYRILIQKGLEREAPALTSMVHEVLSDEQGWASADLHLVHVEQDHDITIVLAHGAVVDKLCLPLKTGGGLSCAMLRRANLNVSRWRLGAQSWKGDLTGYRHYLIGHEVGHLLGMPHVRCPGRGEPAPLMMQQTKRVAPCVRNYAPTEAEIKLLKQRRAYLRAKKKKKARRRSRKL